MARETFTKESFWAELDEAGEEAVRERIATKRYTDGNYKLSLAKEWLDTNERSRQATSAAEHAALARAQAAAASRAAAAAERSADIAERALATAKTANTRATVALAIAAISIIATVVIAYLRPS